MTLSNKFSGNFTRSCVVLKIPRVYPCTLQPYHTFKFWWLPQERSPRAEFLQSSKIRILFLHSEILDTYRQRAVLPICSVLSYYTCLYWVGGCLGQLSLTCSTSCRCPALWQVRGGQGFRRNKRVLFSASLLTDFD